MSLHTAGNGFSLTCSSRGRCRFTLPDFAMSTTSLLPSAGNGSHSQALAGTVASLLKRSVVHEHTADTLPAPAVPATIPVTVSSSSLQASNGAESGSQLGGEWVYVHVNTRTDK